VDIYAQSILDRYKKPFHKGKKIDATISHEEANHSCGDVVKLELEIKNDRLTGYSFSGNGCAISQAATDMLGDLTQNMNIEEIRTLSKEEIYEMLGIEISIRRSKCALLSLLALQNALLKNQNTPSRSWSAYHL